MFGLSWQSWTLIAIAIYFIYKRVYQNADYFKLRNIKTPKSNPIFGFLFDNIFKKRHINDVFREYYNEFPDQRFAYECLKMENLTTLTE